MWKGSNVGYVALHDYIKYHLHKTKLCQMCKIAEPYDLANIDGNYTRDLNTWQWLCRKCHMVSDGRLHSRDSRTGRFVTRQEREEIVVS
jgi:hypothetical protein